jgi:hypothetical protein
LRYDGPVKYVVDTHDGDGCVRTLPTRGYDRQALSLLRFDPCGPRSTDGLLLRGCCCPVPHGCSIACKWENHEVWRTATGRSQRPLPALCVTSGPLFGTRRVTVTVTVTQLLSIFPSTVTAGCNPQTRFATVASGGFNDTQSPLGTPVTPNHLGGGRVVRLLSRNSELRALCTVINKTCSLLGPCLTTPLSITAMKT